MYVWQQVKALRAQGLKIKRIARKLGISKNTVKKYLYSDEPPTFHPRQYGRKIAPYEELIDEMVRKDYIGTRIYEELREVGYDGSLATVHRFLHERGEEQRIQAKVTSRVETAPGEQMQYDWKEWTLLVGGHATKVYIHEVILSFSRKKHYTHSLTITTADVIRAVYEGLVFLGGVPIELVMDNGKQMVITHERDGAILFNEEFLRFLGLMGMEAYACRTYRARTKGKVERPFFHIQEHLLKGLEVADCGELERKLGEYREAFNARSHSTLKESPDERHLREMEHLRAIPCVEPTAFLPRDIRKVSNDGYVSYGGNFYPVPMRLCLKHVFVESVFGRALRVYAGEGECVGEYQVDLNGKGLRPLHPEHEEMNRQYKEGRQIRRAAIVTNFLAVFPEVGALYLEGLRHHVGPNLYGHLKEITGYTALYPVEQVAEVLRECISLGAYHKNTVKRLLATRNVVCRPPMSSALVVPQAAPVSLARDLSCYRLEEVCHG